MIYNNLRMSLSISKFASSKEVFVKKVDFFDTKINLFYGKLVALREVHAYLLKRNKKIKDCQSWRASMRTLAISTLKLKLYNASKLIISNLKGKDIVNGHTPQLSLLLINDAKTLVNAESKRHIRSSLKTEDTKKTTVKKTTVKKKRKLEPNTFVDKKTKATKSRKKPKLTQMKKSTKKIKLEKPLDINDFSNVVLNNELLDELEKIKKEEFKEESKEESKEELKKNSKEEFKDMLKEILKEMPKEEIKDMLKEDSKKEKVMIDAQNINHLDLIDNYKHDDKLSITSFSSREEYEAYLFSF